MKILLIESDRIIAQNVCSALKAGGSQAVWTSDLQSAIETMDKNSPDAVILDMSLAGRSGVEFLYEMRSYPDWQELPVILWTDMSEADAEPVLMSLKDLNVKALLHKQHTHVKDLFFSLGIPAPAI